MFSKEALSAAERRELEAGVRGPEWGHWHRGSGKPGRDGDLTQGGKGSREQEEESGRGRGCAVSDLGWGKCHPGLSG